MRQIIIAFSILSNVFVNAQQGLVGIGTESPRANLDVNGDFNHKGKLFLDDGKGVLLPGKDGQVLVSQGVGKAPTWKTLRVPDYEATKYYLIFNDSFKNFIATNGAASDGGAKTGQGVTFTTDEVSPVIPSTGLVKGALLATLTNTTNKFKVIADLSQSFKVNSSTSKTYFLFETVVQHNNTSTPITNSFACGIFVDGKLESVRINSFTTTSANYGFITHTQIGGVENLSTDNHTVAVACGRLATPGVTTTATVGIGSPAVGTVTNLNNFMTQSSLKVDVYEVPQNFSPIIIP